jgi:hypothetical protein
MGGEETLPLPVGLFVPARITAQGSASCRGPRGRVFVPAPQSVPVASLLGKASRAPTEVNHRPLQPLARAAR